MKVFAYIWQHDGVRLCFSVLQIVTTFAAPGKAAAGLEVELDEVEARAEEFPVTRGFLQLIRYNDMSRFTFFCTFPQTQDHLFMIL